MATLNTNVQVDVTLDFDLNAISVDVTRVTPPAGPIVVTGANVTIQQPDGAQISSPMIIADAGLPTIGYFGTLRKTLEGGIQFGNYSVTVTLTGTGFDPTTITEALNLGKFDEKKAVLAIDDNLFTPSAYIRDTTEGYVPTGLTYIQTSKTWLVQNLTRNTSASSTSLLDFDLKVAGVLFSGKYRCTYENISEYIAQGNTQYKVILPAKLIFTFYLLEYPDYNGFLQIENDLKARDCQKTAQNLLEDYDYVKSGICSEYDTRILRDTFNRLMSGYQTLIYGTVMPFGDEIEPYDFAFCNGIIPPTGGKGWTVLNGLELDGERVIQKVIDYTGGEGTKPSDSIGLYYKTDGSLTANKNEAADLRGLGGPEGPIGPEGPPIAKLYNNDFDI